MKANILLQFMSEKTMHEVYKKTKELSHPIVVDQQAGLIALEHVTTEEGAKAYLKEIGGYDDRVHVIVPAPGTAKEVGGK